MKKLLAALVFVLCGCASSGGERVRVESAREARETIVYVENRSWKDIVVRVDGQRLGLVTALRNEEFKTFRQGSVIISLRPMSESEWLFGPVNLYPGDLLRIQIANQMSMTQIWVERDDR